jgi:transposase InsO family protein
MSKHGDYFDNAAMERWNHRFKVEAIHAEKLTTRALTKNHVFEYIEIYYNRKGLHSTIGFETPESFEVKMPSYFPGQDHPYGCY